MYELGGCPMQTQSRDSFKRSLGNCPFLPLDDAMKTAPDTMRDDRFSNSAGEQFQSTHRLYFSPYWHMNEFLNINYHRKIGGPSPVLV